MADDDPGARLRATAKPVARISFQALLVLAGWHSVSDRRRGGARSGVGRGVRRLAEYKVWCVDCVEFVCST